MDMKNAYIIIPAYKPSDGLIKIVREIKKYGFSTIVIDDGSGAGYNELFGLLEKETVVLHHDVNHGKGRALKTGMEYIRDNCPDCSVFLTADADGQHAVKDIVAVYQHLSTEEIVLGSRKFTGKVPLRSRMGNGITRIVFASASGLRLQDTQTGLRGFRVGLIPSLLTIGGERYEYEINVLLWAAKQRIPMKEVDIETIYEEKNASSHFNTVRDSALIYSEIIKFSASSLIAFFIDFIVLMVMNALTKQFNAGESLLISIVTARIISSAINFTMNHKLVFKSAEDLRKALVKYYALVVVILAANTGLMYVGTILIGLPLVPVKLITEVVLFALSYIVQKSLVFRKQRVLAMK